MYETRPKSAGVPTVCVNEGASISELVVLENTVLDNRDATGSPTTADDASQGYEIGSEWINTSTGTEYVCVDSSTGAAVWKATTAGAGGLVHYSEVTAATTASTTSSSYVPINGMSVTPPSDF